MLQSITTHKYYEETALRTCGLSVWPERTLVTYQNREHPNRFYPIRFAVPETVVFEEVIKPENGWIIVVVEFSKGVPMRWCSFAPGFFKPTDWGLNRGFHYVSVTSNSVERMLIPVNGGGIALVREPSLREWMDNRRKEQWK